MAKKSGGCTTQRTVAGPIEIKKGGITKVKFSTKKPPPYPKPPINKVSKKQSA